MKWQGYMRKLTQVYPTSHALKRSLIFRPKWAHIPPWQHDFTGEQGVAHRISWCNTDFQWQIFANLRAPKWLWTPEKGTCISFPWPGFPRYFSAVLWAEKSKLPCLPPFNSNFDMKIVHGKGVGMEDIPKIQEWRRWRLFKTWNGSVRCYQMLSHGVSGKGDLEAKTPNSPGKARDKREPSSWFPHFIGIFRTSPSISSRTTDLGEHPSVLRADKQENICSTGPYRCDPSTKAAELRSILISEHTFHVSSNVSTSDENWRIVPFPQTRDPVKNDRNSEYVS